MALNPTLTSLAVLRTVVNSGGDYLTYFEPFVLHAINVSPNGEPIKDRDVKTLLFEEVGLEIPLYTVQLLLKRFRKKRIVLKENGLFYKNDRTPQSIFPTEKQKIGKTLKKTIDGFIEFCENQNYNKITFETGEKRILQFLSQFGVKCLRAFHKNHALPEHGDPTEEDLFTVSAYISNLHKSDPSGLADFMIVAEGHFLANALMCPELGRSPRDFKKVTFYLDTPVILSLLGLDSEEEQNSVVELVDLLSRLKAGIACFDHTIDETRKVIQSASENFERFDSSGKLVSECRRKGLSQSDLVLVKEKIDQKLDDFKIEIIPRPKPSMRFQIDEQRFQEILADKVNYRNEKARLIDIESVRSIYNLREGLRAGSIENCKAVLVTSNSGYAEAAYEYGREFESSSDVSAVITDFSLANVAWLKVPLDSSSIPEKEVIAFAYASIKPSPEFIARCIDEAEKLNLNGVVDDTDLDILRSSFRATDELFQMTATRDVSLSKQTMQETLRRVKRELVAKENQALQIEQKGHIETRKQLEKLRMEKLAALKNADVASRSRAEVEANSISVVFGGLLICGLLIGGLNLSGLSKYFVISSTVVVLVFSSLNLFFGSTLKELRNKYIVKRGSNLYQKKVQLLGLDQ